MKKVTYEVGIYQSHASSVRSVRKIEADAIYRSFEREAQKDVLRFRQILSDITVTKLSPNKTGRKICVRSKVSGKAFSFTVFPYEGLAIDPKLRSVNGLRNELIEHIVKKESLFFKTVSDSARKTLLKGSDYYESMFSKQGSILNVLKQYLLQMSPYEGVENLHKAVCTFVSEGRHLANFNLHQSTKATENFREIALHAMRHGAKFEDLLSVLQEEAVRVTMDV